MGQTIEEIFGVGTRISPQINEDFSPVKFALNKLHLIEIIVYRNWDFELPSANKVFALSKVALKNFDCINNKDYFRRSLLSNNCKSKK